MTTEQILFAVYLLGTVIWFSWWSHRMDEKVESIETILAAIRKRQDQMHWSWQDEVTEPNRKAHE